MIDDTAFFSPFHLEFVPPSLFPCSHNHCLLLPS